MTGARTGHREQRHGGLFLKWVLGGDTWGDNREWLRGQQRQSELKNNIL